MITNINIPTLTLENIENEGTLTVNTNLTINVTSTTFGINIVGSGNTDQGTQIAFTYDDALIFQIGPNFTNGSGSGQGIYDFIFYNQSLEYNHNQFVIQHDTFQVIINSTLSVSGIITANNLTTLQSYTAQVSGDFPETITCFYQLINNYIFYYVPYISWTIATGYIYITVPCTSPVTSTAPIVVYGNNTPYPETIYYGGGTNNLVLETLNLNSGYSAFIEPFVFMYLYST